MAKKIIAITGKVNAPEFVAKHGYPEVGQFDVEKSMQKFYKQLDTAVLEDWAKLEGVEYKASDNEAIHRMRVCMALLYKHFPRPAAPKKESKYASYSLEDLVNMATENDVAVEMSDDDRIMRMRLIMALRANKVIG